MSIEKFYKATLGMLIPELRNSMVYRCLGCGQTFKAIQLLYTCPHCQEVLLIEDNDFNQLKNRSPEEWRRIFDFRRLLNEPWSKGIFRYHELIAPMFPTGCVVYLGEGHTPLVEASSFLRVQFGGQNLWFKQDGQNPSGSFKDRGMAAAVSFLNFLAKIAGYRNLLSVCASTGDTSASAALYGAYLAPVIATAVLLPQGLVTPQQLSQPLGAGASVFELPGVFDDCMKVVENLARRFNVALLNSKNAWRILGQQSLSFELAQDRDWDMSGAVIFVPIGNAGNITAILTGFLKLHELGIITELPKIIGVQSHHADPVFRYYSENAPEKRVWKPVPVQASVAQAAMIGNPVSMPRVIELVERYGRAFNGNGFRVIKVTEQAIMDATLKANRAGHPICTQGGEALAGVTVAQDLGMVHPDNTAIVVSTAHAIKFSGFSDMYFQNSFPHEYGIVADPGLVNRPVGVRPSGVSLPAPGNNLPSEEMQKYVEAAADDIANRLSLEPRD